MGAINEKTITLNLVYDFNGMINKDLIQENSLLTMSLTYGQKISKAYATMPSPVHEGYEFVGWFFNSDYSGTQITADTIINESIWNVDEVEKTAYAKWTIKQFDVSVVIVTNNVIDDDGGYVTEVEGRYDYNFNLSLVGKEHSNFGYSFDGYATKAVDSPDYSLLENGLTIGSEDVTLFAKFISLKLVLTLDSNGGTFVRSGYWTFDDSNKTATIEIEFNKEVPDLVVANKTGYVQNISMWEDKENSKKIEITVDSIKEYYGETKSYKTLYVVWEANDYSLILDANGGYFENVDEEVWNVTNIEDGIISVQITYGQKIGDSIESIVIPQKTGWEFAGWDDTTITEDFVWEVNGSVTLKAIWNEVEYEIIVESQHGKVNAMLFTLQGDYIGEQTLNSGDSFKAWTTNTVKLTSIVDTGYVFTNWTSTDEIIDVIVSNNPDVTKEELKVQICDVVEFLKAEGVIYEYDR